MADGAKSESRPSELMAGSYVFGGFAQAMVVKHHRDPNVYLVLGALRYQIISARYEDGVWNIEYLSDGKREKSTLVKQAIG